MNKQKDLQYGLNKNVPTENSSGIDWISATFPFAFHESSGQSIVLQEEKNKGVPMKGHNGYTEAYHFPSGAMIMQNPSSERMGTHLIMSARTIANCEIMYNVSQFDLLSGIAKNGRISRLDVRFDYISESINIRRLYDEIVKGVYGTRAKSFSYVESAKSGKEKGAATCYIGSQKKRKKLMRIYDKGSQLGLSDMWTRYELEIHGGIAVNATKELLDGGTEKLSENIIGMINGYVDLRDTISEFRDASKVKISLPKYERSDTAKWLLTTVAKTLAKEVHLDNSLYELFIQEFAREFRELEGKIESSE